MKYTLTLLLSLLALMTTPLGAIDSSTSEEYDLYDRNRDERDFNKYDYPDKTADCPYCKIKKQQGEKMGQTRR